MKLPRVGSEPTWFEAMRRHIDRAFTRLESMPEFTVAGGLPAAADVPRTLIYVSDEAGGAVPAFSDGTNWRRVTDRAIVS